MRRSSAALSAAVVVSLSFGLPAHAQPDDGLSLKPVAGQGKEAGNDFRVVGAGKAAQAQFTHKEAYSGSHSVLLEKAAPTTEFVYAAAVVQGVEGMPVADLGTLGFWVNGSCGGGSPRFNLAYDVDGDGGTDAVAFYGCAANAKETDGDWTRMSVEATSRAPATATVTGLSVLVDEQGTYHVDDVQVAGETLGGPSD